MRYVRDIVASCLLETLLLGDVTEEARGSDDGFFVIFDRHDRGRIRAVFCLDRALVSFTGLKTVIKIFPDFFKRDQLQFLGKKILSGNLFEKRRDRVVGIVRLKILVYGNDTFGNDIEDLFEAVTLCGNTCDGFTELFGKVVYGSGEVTDLTFGLVICADREVALT